MAEPFISTPMAQPRGATDRPIRRRFVVDGRVRSGCLTCKARKKKCDGQASSTDSRCKSCVRLGLVCEQLPLRRVAPRPPRRKTGTSSQQQQQDNTASPEEAASTKDESKSSVSPPASVETPSTDNDDEGSHGKAILATSRQSMPVLAGSWEGMERLLLRYFLDHVAPLCSILQQDGGSFCKVLLPMAFVDSSLLHALFAYASSHSDSAAPVLPVTAEARLEFENQVARGVAEAITKNAVTETTLACALIISTAEVVRGDTSRWLLHLQGAGHLVNHLGAAGLLRTADGAFLLRYFAYHDIMAALSTGNRPLLDGVYWVQDIDAKIEAADSFMGLAHHVLRHLTTICAFVADTADLEYSSSTDRRSRVTLQADDMAQALRQQDLQLQVDLTDRHIDALVHHAEAFRFASLFYLYRHLLRFCDAGAVYRLRMADCVREIFRHVSLIPANLFCEMGLLFPLFMAGIGSMDDAETSQYIHNRLRSIENWTKFRHVTRAREMLQLLQEKGRTDWEVMLRELNWHLSLA